MGFQISFEGDLKGITVPYPPLHDEIRNNRGFTDLRGRPDEARKIAEGLTSSALQNLLVGLARPGSSLFTLGCDLGAHREKRGPKRLREVAGGYVQVICVNYANVGPEEYRVFAEAVGTAIGHAVGADHWKVKFVLTAVRFNLDGYADVVPSVWTWFWASGATPAAALASRGRLIGALAGALIQNAITKPLKIMPAQTC